MTAKNRTSYYGNTSYIHIESTIGDFIVDEEIGAVHIVDANINHFREQEIELSVGSGELSEVFGIINTISINQFKQELTKLGAAL